MMKNQATLVVAALSPPGSIFIWSVGHYMLKHEHLTLNPQVYHEVQFLEVEL